MFNSLAFGHFSVTGWGQSIFHLSDALMTNKNEQCCKYNISEAWKIMHTECKKRNPSFQASMDSIKCKVSEGFRILIMYKTNCCFGFFKEKKKIPKRNKHKSFYFHSLHSKQRKKKISILFYFLLYKQTLMQMPSSVTGQVDMKNIA